MIVRKENASIGNYYILVNDTNSNEDLFSKGGLINGEMDSR